MNAAKLSFGAVAALALAGTVCVGSATAQDYRYTDNPNPGYVTTTEGVTVYAPRQYGHSAIGAPIESVRESRIVYARDLDVSMPWGAQTLRRRIEHAARDACDDLDARYPITEDAGPDCFDGAVRGAMRHVEYRLGFTPPTWWY